jgi:acyl-CoA hydrolase
LPHRSASLTPLADIRNGDHVFIGTGCAAPQTLLKALDALPVVPADLELLRFFTINAFERNAEDHITTRFRHRVFFVGTDMRGAVKQGLVEYVPMSAARVPEMIERGRIRVDVALIQVSLPDEFGYVSLGVSVDIIPAAVARARLVIAEVNPAMPRSMGDSTLHISRIHHLVPVDGPVTELGRNRPRRRRCSASPATSPASSRTAPRCRSVSASWRTKRCSTSPTARIWASIPRWCPTRSCRCWSTAA